jgi:hypothetical protein
MNENMSMIIWSGTVLIVRLKIAKVSVFCCLIGYNSYEYYFILNVVLGRCFKDIIFVELLDNIQLDVWSSFRDYQGEKNIP